MNKSNHLKQQTQIPLQINSITYEAPNLNQQQNKWQRHITLSSPANIAESVFVKWRYATYKNERSNICQVQLLVMCANSDRQQHYFAKRE
ncbi:hypothetical protein [Teredinibacter franksiae]|uniref:hypothetical protein n=1 Tax=Teredinibacter franksiae TaxID=2761453 RepID=UPI001625CDBD|nr:hypothetical protein [Teredinibacter franksiae]